VTGPVRFVKKSTNGKLAKVERSVGIHLRPIPPFVAETSVSIEGTCPDTCPFKRNGCYADAGLFTHAAVEKMDRAAAGLSALEIIRREAEAIRRAFRGGPVPDRRDLRLHVAGDVRDGEQAALLAKEARRWTRYRGGGRVWGFTHSWRAVPRGSWGGISVLASVERPVDVEEAHSRGYPSAIVVEAFPDGKRAFRLPGTTARIVPCPAETLEKSCVECRLCLNADKLHTMNTAIAFQVHGQQRRAARAALRVL
jgi:hypothetical protein